VPPAIPLRALPVPREELAAATAVAQRVVGRVGPRALAVAGLAIAAVGDGARARPGWSRLLTNVLRRGVQGKGVQELAAIGHLGHQHQQRGQVSAGEEQPPGRLLPATTTLAADGPGAALQPAHRKRREAVPGPAMHDVKEFSGAGPGVSVLPAACASHAGADGGEPEKQDDHPKGQPQ
jgi:hypothetical protein